MLDIARRRVCTHLCQFFAHTCARACALASAHNSVYASAHVCPSSCCFACCRRAWFRGSDPPSSRAIVSVSTRGVHRRSPRGVREAPAGERAAHPESSGPARHAALCSLPRTRKYALALSPSRAHAVCSAGATAGRSLQHPHLYGTRADAAEPRPDHATDRHLQPRCRLVLSSKTKPHSTVHVAEHPSLDSESPSSHSSLELDDTSPLPHGALHEDCPHSGSVHTHPCSTEQKLSRQRLPVPAATAQVRCTKHICHKPSNGRGLTKARLSLLRILICQLPKP